MKPLAIYFNEISLHGELTDLEWSRSAEELFHVLNDFLQLRSDGEIIFIDDILHSICGNLPLIGHFGKLKEKHKTKYQRFLSRIKLRKIAMQLQHEVRWRHQTTDNQSSNGLTQAALNNSWCFSMTYTHSDWLLEKISAQYDSMDESAHISSIACEVNNLASHTHLSVWQTAIEDWGRSIATSSVLDSLKGHAVVMYSAPLEHNPPHVHVLHKGSGDTLAKYRIEDGAREDGKPTLDAEMRMWLTQYKDQLLRSWERCQRGGHPYQLHKISH